MSLVSVNAEDLAVVLSVACLIESRDATEQRALLKVAERCDRARNARTVTNKRWTEARETMIPSALELAVHGTRAPLEEGERYVRPSWERRRR